MLPLTMSEIGQGVFAKAIALNTSGDWHISEMPETCRPSPPAACGVPSNRLSLRRLHSGSCCILPLDTPNSVTCMPVLEGIRQLSLPPPPIMVGATADITGGVGVDPGAEPAPL